MFPDSFPVPLNFHRSHKVTYLPDHPADLRCIIQHHASIDLAQPHPANDLALSLWSADATMNQCNLEHFTQSLYLSTLIFANTFSPGSKNLGWRPQLAQSFDGRLDQVMRIM